MAYFSIIVPIFNKEKCIDAFVKGILEQSCGDFELIMVDDASKDSSAEVIQKWMSIDERVRGVFQKNNSGILISRKKGFSEATGKFIWFMDPDDSIASKNTLEKLKSELEKQKVDIYQFGTEVKIHTTMSPVDKDNLLKSVKAYAGRMEGEQVFHEGFVKKSFSFHIWNRICPREIWKRVFEYVPNVRAMMSEDFLTTFLLTYFAKSYYGTNKLKCYKYNFGEGVSSSSKMDMNKIVNRSTQATVIDSLKKAFKTIAPDDTEVQEILNSYEQKMIIDSLYVWFHFVNTENSPRAFEILSNAWSLDRLFPVLLRDYWDSRWELIKKTAGYKPDNSNKGIKTVGIYYYRVRNGGIEKVISLVIPMLLSKGYKVVLITDEPKSEEDYYIPDEIERVVIRKCGLKDKKGFTERVEQLKTIIREKNIDAVVYHAWNDLNLFWDMRAVQRSGSRFFVQTHLVFSSTISWLGESWNYISDALSSADGVITITSTDCKYWSIYNSNTVKISNPIDSALLENKVVSRANHNIVWIARFEDYKRPKDVFPIMKKVISEIPDARLIMLGTTENKSELEKYIELSKQYGLDDVIEFAGFHKDISDYYKNAGVHLLTSDMEGFSMVLLESKSYGIPTVMYDLNYLDMVRDDRGILTSPLGDTDGLAESIIRLFKDDELWIQESLKARESFEDFAKENLADKWDAFFKKNTLKNTDNDRFSDDAINRTIMDQINLEVWKRENRLLYGNELTGKEALKIAAKRIVKRAKRFRK